MVKETANAKWLKSIYSSFCMSSKGHQVCYNKTEQSKWLTHWFFSLIFLGINNLSFGRCFWQASKEIGTYWKKWGNIVFIIRSSQEQPLLIKIGIFFQWKCYFPITPPPRAFLALVCIVRHSPKISLVHLLLLFL